MGDIEAIKQLKARYFRTLDTKDWAAFRQVFTDDVVIDTTASGGELITGADAFLTYLDTALAGTTTVHQGHMPEIEVTSDSTATGIWALHDIVIWPGGMRLDGYGHYHETYTKTADGWRIAGSKLTRLHTDFTQ
ncbi:MAG: nuclear transport factor 2 family protein [Actinomycetota bacterium]|nr:nuclear transport factor 2 family protein [Actinomycetota bacterium]